MAETGKTTGADMELHSVLKELSFSYMMVNSTQQSLNDLDQSIKELETLVDFLDKENQQ